MLQIERILCPTDFSEFSRHAFEQAVALGRWYRSEITVLHVFSMPMAASGVAGYAGPAALDGRQLLPDYGAERAADLKRFVELAAGDGVPIKQVVAEGSIVGEILDRARDLTADLIVMGTHGRSGFDRLLLGSTTERVLRKAPCPVLTVPRRTTAMKAAFKRILCAVDFSEPSLLALTYALSLAQEADAALCVAHVIELLPEAAAADLDRILDSPQFRTRVEWNARERLSAAIPQGARVYCRIDEVLATGKAYKEVLRLAAEREADLIVMGVHGRRMADPLLFGSTTQHVVRQASCPVLTLRSRT